MRLFKFALLFTIMFLATSVSSRELIIGGGVKTSMYSTGEIRNTGIQVLGIGVNTKTEGTAGFLVPHKTFMVQTLGRGTDSAGVRTIVYESKLQGLYFFNVSENSKFSPFFLLSGNVEVLDSDKFKTDTDVSSDVGLGTTYSIGESVSIWAASSVKMGKDIILRLGGGLAFDF